MLEEGKAALDMKNPNKMIIFKYDAALALLAQGMTLNQSTSTNALWFETADGADTPYKCGWNIKRTLEKNGQIDRKREGNFVVTYVISKQGKRDHDKAAERRDVGRQADEALKAKQDAKLVTSKALPAQRFDNVKHNELEAKKLPKWWPKTFAVYRSKDHKDISGEGYAIHGIVFRGGKTVVYWTSTDCIAQFDTFQKFEEVHLRGTLHGESVVQWFDERERAPEPPKEPPKSLKACFYCNNGFTTSTRGRKAWRNVCKEAACRDRYAEDTKLRKELIESGVDASSL